MDAVLTLTVPGDAAGKTLHSILRVTYNGTPPLSGHRIVLGCPLQRFDEPFDGSQRRAQLVARIGDEVGAQLRMLALLDDSSISRSGWPRQA